MSPSVVFTCSWYAGLCKSNYSVLMQNKEHGPSVFQLLGVLKWPPPTHAVACSRVTAGQPAAKASSSSLRLQKCPESGNKGRRVFARSFFQEGHPAWLSCRPCRVGRVHSSTSSLLYFTTWFWFNTVCVSVQLLVCP